MARRRGHPQPNLFDGIGRIDARRAVETHEAVAEDLRARQAIDPETPTEQHGGFDTRDLQEAKAWLGEHRDAGVHCPLCTQFVKVYRRQIHGAMARALILMYRQGGGDYVHLPTITGYGGDTAKLVHWGLIEEMPEERADGGRVGWWRVTGLGRQFVQRQAKVPRYALIFDGRCLALEGEDRDIIEALGERFDYTELMTT